MELPLVHLLNDFSVLTNIAVFISLDRTLAMYFGNINKKCLFTIQFCKPFPMTIFKWCPCLKAVSCLHISSSVSLKRRNSLSYKY